GTRAPAGYRRVPRVSPRAGATDGTREVRSSAAIMPRGGEPARRGSRDRAQRPFGSARTVGAMERAFVVLRSRGPGWDDAKPLEAQSDWAGPAAFMDALFEQRFAALVGPLEGTRDALLVLRASSAAEVVERLAADPWTTNGLLCTKQISPWQLRLGTL